jgi:single-strand DNA-binding protein
VKQQVTVSGLIATTPRYLVTFEGLGILSFRMASESAGGSNDYTNWYTVTLTGASAVNANTSFNKGDRVLVFGELKIRDWDNGERTGTSVEIEAITAGHDLKYGTSVFSRQQAQPQAKKPAHRCDCGMCGSN